MFFKINTKHLYDHKKITKGLNIESFLNPKFIYYPLQTDRETFEQLVSIGDNVLKGESILRLNGRFSYDIHSSVSGKVIEIRKMWHSSGKMVDMLVIENNFLENSQLIDFNQTILNQNTIVEIIKDAGIIGLGGAGFPTYAKYLDLKNIDVVILNGVECEPYLTCDYAIMKEEMPKIIKGLEYLMIAAGAKKGVIAVKNNKKELIELIKEQLINHKNIFIELVKDQYPVGWEKYLVQKVVKKSYNTFPKEVGAIVNNVQTAFAVYNAVENRLPLLERVITVTGDGINHPKNLKIKVGSSINEIIEYCGGYSNNNNVQVMIAGGPMTGKACLVDSLVITANVSGVIVNSCNDTTSEACIGCGNCDLNCPVKLSPTVIKKAYLSEDYELLQKIGITRCISCGLCSYVCPSRVEMTDYMQKAKKFVVEKERNA